MFKGVPLFFALLTIMLCSLTAKGAVEKKAQAKIQTDTSKIEVKTFNNQALIRYSRQKDFNYTGQATGQPSLWQRIWNWFWSKFDRLFSRVPYSGTVLTYVLLGLCVGFLVYIIAKYSGASPDWIWAGDTKKVNLPYKESVENIHELNFDVEIEKALSTNNYRMAVRLLYLMCLKQLSDTNLIKWEIDKTNSAYINELEDPKQKQTFALLTHQFEYAWYGNFTIDRQVFNNVNQLFQNFKSLLP
jgi:hypothetical protein